MRRREAEQGVAQCEGRVVHWSRIITSTETKLAKAEKRLHCGGFRRRSRAVERVVHLRGFLENARRHLT